MHLDFHYYLTFMAALDAGLPADAGLQIAECAEIVDETYNGVVKKKRVAGRDDQSYYWTPESLTKNGHVQRTVTAVASKLMVQRGEKRGKWFNLSWTGFHFLPNLDDQATRNEYKEIYKWSRQDVNFFNKKYLKGDPRGTPNMGRLEVEQKLICYPDSKLVASMNHDTQNAITSHLRGSLGRWIHTAVGAGFVDRFEKAVGGPLADIMFLNALIGLRLHVFADTWAHQGFAGVRSPRINDVEGLKVGVGIDRSGTRPAPVVDVVDHRSASDSGFGPKSALPASHSGHGNALRYPDYPAYHYSYVRPFDGKRIERSNPVEYSEAYEAVHFFLQEYRKYIYKAHRRPRDRGAFAPSKIDSRFFRNDLAHTDKYLRYKRLYEIIRSHLRNDPVIMPKLVKPEATAKDFGVIDALRTDRNGVIKLAYFSLAARCHLAWLEKELNKVFKPDFNWYVQQNQTYKV